MRGTALLLAFVLALPLLAATAGAPLPKERWDIPADAAAHLTPPDPTVQGWPSYARQGEPLPPRPLQTTGTARVVVLLIDFTDTPPAPAHDGAFFDANLNADGPSDRTLRSYYREVSFGSLTVNATVIPTWWHSIRTMSHYGQDGGNGVDNANGPIYRLVIEAVQAADPTVNFAPFDTDADGVVDHVFVIHSGAGQENNAGNTNLIWSHRWAVLDANPSVPGSQALTADGKQVYGYIMASEDSPIGVVAHEFGHDLGLPDLYDTDGSSPGVGEWDLMGGGSWNGFPRGSSPAALSAWSRIHLAWVVPTTVTTPLPTESIPAVETSGRVYRLPIRSTFLGDEYFLVENRQPIGFDEFLPGFGLLIWHIDDAVAENADDLHRLVDLEEADEGTTGDHPLDPADPWRDTAIGFGPDTVPDSDSYTGDSTGWRVRDVSASADPMVATIARAIGRDLAVSEVRVPAHAAVGQTVTARVVVRNEGLTPADVDLLVRRYRYLVDSPALVDEQSFAQAGLAGGTSTTFDLSFVPLAVGRYLVDATVRLAGDEIASNNERMAHVLANEFALREDVESSAIGWSVDGTTSDPHQWRIVEASEENGSAHSPTHAFKFGYVPVFPPNLFPPVWHTLTSPVVGVAGGPTFLIFYHRYDLWGRTETPLEINVTETDHGYVEVRTFVGAWGPWAKLAEYRARDLTWRGVSFNLTSAVASATELQVRFNVSSDVTPSSGGWWVDDVMIGAAGLGRAVVIRGPEAPIETPPAAELTVDIKLFNVGDMEDSFVLTGTPPPGWSALVRTGATEAPINGRKVQLAPDRDFALTIVLRIPGGAAEDTSHTTTIRATSEGDANATDAVPIDVRIVRGGGLLDPRILLPILLVLAVAVVAVLASILVRARRRRPPAP